MLKKTITYTDYDGTERTEDFYFNLSKAEITEMQLGVTGGLIKMLERIVAEKDSKKIMEVFKEIILKSYGEKSPDGKRFMKSKEIADSFVSNEAYSVLLMEMLDADGAAVFVNGILPKIS